MEKKATNSWAVFGVIVCTGFTSISQLLWKIGVSDFTPSFYSLITNFYIISGCILYGLGAVLLVASFRYGELSILYPFVSLSFIWVAILSLVILEEEISYSNWLGVIFISSGICFVGRGATV